MQVLITLSARFHALLVALMPSRGEAEEINYLVQVRQGLGVAAQQPEDYEGPLPFLMFDPEKLITVSVTPRLVERLYLVMGSQQERLVAHDNKLIQQALILQLMANPDYHPVLAGLQEITEANARQTEELRFAGYSFLNNLFYTQPQ